jgi:hypothetical protein
MEDQKTPELEMLSKIHNQLIDIKQILVEIELSKPGTSHTLQTRLQQIVGSDKHVDGEGRAGIPEVRQQKVIAPTNEGIQAGEAKDAPTGAGQ